MTHLTTLTLLMGVVFQLPVIAFVLGKLGIVNAAQLARYRKHAFLVIMTVAAIITPDRTSSPSPSSPCPYTCFMRQALG